MFCSKCGVQLNEGSAFCSRCGARVGPVVEEVAADVSPKSRLATSLLAVFLGWTGAHRFYMGKVMTAVTMLTLGVAYLACWSGIVVVAATSGEDGWPPLFWVLYGLGMVFALLLCIWSLVDFVIAVTGNLRDSQGKIIKKW